MIGKCDQCENENRKLKYVYHYDDPILAICRFGCENQRSIPSAKNRKRPFEIISIMLLSKSYEETLWEVKVRAERRSKTFRVRRYADETQSSLITLIKKRCENLNQVANLNVDIYLN
ncbi:hypothetical protein [Paenibacillus massiliensis]|uniref:hypothetical protein n=1 Tax=Paenibacillus massiliensis TaxID=225917 RepID=UPI00048FD547|nr:hypothetical protein [Paenibacillus massiliensis]